MSACAGGGDPSGANGLFGNGPSQGGANDGDDDDSFPSEDTGSNDSDLDDDGTSSGAEPSDDGLGDHGLGDDGPDSDGPEGNPCETDSEPCYTGPADTQGQGQCKAGTRNCTDGVWGTCEDESLPSTEVCDNMDNDCNGSVDDGNPGGGETCETGEAGVCAAGLTACVNGDLICEPLGQPTAEICDGVDNNCNEATDEGNPGGGAACNTGLSGVCAAGTLTCSNGALSCEPDAPGTVEQCQNDEDDDCDGQVDEGCGECAHSLCAIGQSLDPDCDPCVAAVCETNLVCCFSLWEGACINLAQNICGHTC